MNLCIGALLLASLAIFVAWLNVSIVWVEKSIQFLCDLELVNSENVTLVHAYDFIIVGAGSSGCAIANRLSENPDWNVLLIEAGPEENIIMDIPAFVVLLQQSSKINWAYQTVPSEEYCLAMKHHSCIWPRGKVMGGSSVLNYMIYTRGNRKDFNHWAEMGNIGWSYDDVLPIFQKMENSSITNGDISLAGKYGPLSVSYIDYRSNVSKAFMNGIQELGLSSVNYNSKNQIGVSYVQTTTQNGYRHSANRAYIDPIRAKRKNLHIKTKSLVTKILIDEQQKSAIGIELLHNGNKHLVHAKKEVIISAGAINSPQLLLLSGIGPADQLKRHDINVIADLPVGLNLMDHVMAGAVTFTVNVTTPYIESQEFQQLKSYIRNGSGTFSLCGGVESISFFNIDKFGDINAYPDVEILEISGSIYEMADIRQNFHIDPILFNEMYGELERKKQKAITLTTFVLRPKSRGFIYLKNASPLIYPNIVPNYFTDPYDMELSIKGLKKILELQKTDAFKRINAKVYWPPIKNCNHLERESDAYLECFIRHLSLTVYHYSGTCKMGTQNDKTSVVNPKLQVIGLKNLRVADASIMPEIISGHPNAATIMIGEKAAEIIKNDWK